MNLDEDGDCCKTKEPGTWSKSSHGDQISYRYLFDELFDMYIENSKSINSDETPEEARLALDTLCTK